MNRFLIPFAILLFVAVTTLHAEETLVYKKTGDSELKLFIDKPDDWKASDKRPAIVFFSSSSSAVAGWADERLSFKSRASISPRAAWSGCGCNIG